MGVSKIVQGWLKTVDPITTRMQVLINAKGIRTGSYVFGGYHEGESDIDVIFPPSIRLSQFDNCFAYQFDDYHQGNYQSFYVKNEKGEIYNLLFMFTDEEYFRWVTATAFMKATISEGDEYTDKKKRVALFEKFKKEAL